MNNKRKIIIISISSIILAFTVIAIIVNVQVNKKISSTKEDKGTEELSFNSEIVEKNEEDTDNTLQDENNGEVNQDTIEIKGEDNNQDGIQSITNKTTNTQKTPQNKEQTQVTSSGQTTQQVETVTEKKQEVVESKVDDVPTKVEKPVIPPVETTPESIKNCNSKHAINAGNSGKWFDNKAECDKYFEEITKYWGDKWKNYEIDTATYNKNCPYGYECYSCYVCGKWTVNFKYN